MQTARVSGLMVVALIAAGPSDARALPQSDTDQAAVIARAREAVVRALDFQQGDRASLTDARDDFTPEAWQAFLKHLTGWLDAAGAPTFSSSFATAGKPTVAKQDNGLVRLTLPGTLTHVQNKSRTTYRAAVVVDVGGTPLKILRLEEITCPGASTACQGGSPQPGYFALRAYLISTLFHSGTLPKLR